MGAWMMGAQMIGIYLAQIQIADEQDMRN